ncbi:McrC family protein [Novosphingobium decolorationis]|uniref:Calmodulin-binding protein n=1 Tax=Novosphingobium decolorationis TaxID=2698673 RepID=A0ABX8E7N0_9SPHN|nr:McrC family protein [Novosphingobium decolorationis]QVM85182.1 calmodulin-binding protein [Novosphingobium decolorationis]
MRHLACPEWGRIAVAQKGAQGALSPREALALEQAARSHPLGGRDGCAILTHYRDHVKVGQLVGVLSAPGISLEILPKIDPASHLDNRSSLRARLVSLIDLAHDLRLAEGEAAAMARGAETLLDLFIRIFATRLATQARQGLPRHYLAREDDLRALRGQLHATRQFTVNAVRPDRLACRYDELDADIPLMQVMACAIVSLRRRTRTLSTARLLDELRYAFDDVTLLPPNRLPWQAITIERSNKRWESLLKVARMLLGQDWQGTGHKGSAPRGHSLLFPMNDLFEKAVATLLRRGLADAGYDVRTQDQSRYCLRENSRDLFQMRPDIVIRKNGRTVAIIDTKWKPLDADHLDRGHLDQNEHDAGGEPASLSGKGGVSQGDVYQMMAYGQVHDCAQLMLLYPARPGSGSRMLRSFTVHPDGERTLSIAAVDMAASPRASARALRDLIVQSLDRTRPSPRQRAA